MRPIRARKVLVHGQGMVAAVGDLKALLFLSCLRCAAAAILLASWDFPPMRTDARHFGLFIAACSHELCLIPKAFSETLRVSLKRFFWPPRESLLCWSSPNKSFLGSRWSGMGTAWPVQRSWVCIKMLWMLERLAWVSTSVSGILSCHFMPGPASWHDVDKLSMTHILKAVCEHYRFVDIDLCLRGDASSVPHILVESAKGDNSLGESGVDFVVDDNSAGECTAKICELFHYVESLSVDRGVGFNVGLPWSGLVHHLSLGADCEPKVVAGIRERIDAALHGYVRGSFEGAVISKQEVVDGIC